MNRTFQASFPTDADDFLSRRCPHCAASFKQRVGSGGKLRAVACPHCGVRSERWETPAQQAYLEALVEHNVVAPVLADFEKSMKSLGRSGSGLTVRVTQSPSGKAPPAPPRETSSELPAETTTSCCSERIRHAEGLTLRFCPACGGALGREVAP